MDTKTKGIKVLETKLKTAQIEFKTTFANLEYMLEDMEGRLFTIAYKYIEGVDFTLSNRQKFEKAQREFSEVLIDFNKLWTDTITSAWYNVTALQDRLRYEQKRKE